MDEVEARVLAGLGHQQAERVAGDASALEGWQDYSADLVDLRVAPVVSQMPIVPTAGPACSGTIFSHQSPRAVVSGLRWCAAEISEAESAPPSSRIRRVALERLGQIQVVV